MSGALRRLARVAGFESEDGRALIAAEIAITSYALVSVSRFSVGLLAGEFARRLGTAAGILSHRVFRALVTAGRVLHTRAVSIARRGLSLLGSMARQLDARLFQFAQQSRVFANVYWALLTLAAIGIVLAAVSALR